MKNQYHVKRTNCPVNWTVTVPGSKSMTNRALLMAALSDGKVVVEGVLFSDDSRHFLSSLAALGFELDIDEPGRRVHVTGCNGEIPRKEAEINVGSAGTAARFLTAMLGFSDGVYTVQASEQMKKRPMQQLFELLADAGARITYLEEEGHLPVRIEGCRHRSEDEQEGEPEQTSGEVQKPLELELDISKSTQFLSALLLITPMIKQGLCVHITSKKTDGSYIRITRNMMEEFGVSIQYDGRNYKVAPGASYHMDRYMVEPDASAACYFYAAAALTGGRTLVWNMHGDNTQGDLRFLEVLRMMGCAVVEGILGITVVGPDSGMLRGISIDMNDFSDQALTLAAIAPFAKSPVHIRGIGHIREQECDRIHAIVAELTKLGVQCNEEPDAVTIYPGVPHGGVIETYDDHRVAMAFSLLGLRTDGVVIDNPECCGKTFEEYFEILDALTEGSLAEGKVAPVDCD